MAKSAASASFAPLTTFDQTMEEAFPANVDSGHKPMGEKVLVQLRCPKTKSKGGIELVSDTKDAIHWNNQSGKIVEMGPVAFRNRQTLEPWPEGAWAEVGDYVRVPKYGGDRFEVPYGDGVVLFVILKDMDLVAKVTCDPRSVISFV
jgi:co-chaperonin GroES (HSP10)